MAIEAIAIEASKALLVSGKVLRIHKLAGAGAFVGGAIDFHR